MVMGGFEMRVLTLSRGGVPINVVIAIVWILLTLVLLNHLWRLGQSLHAAKNPAPM